MKPPSGVTAARVGRISVWTRPEVMAWVELAIGEAGSLHAHASRTPDRSSLEGRGPVHVIPAAFQPPTDQPAQWAVRRFYRGGGVRWLGDRHLRSPRPRPFSEWIASDLLRSKGVATPQVQAAAVHASGLVYRGDIVTEYIPDGVELATLLFGDREGDRNPALVESALSAAGTLVRQIAEAGVHHPDLNARNILLRPAGTAWTAVVLDLDRCRIGEARANPSAMLARLTRSIEKLGRASGIPVPARALRALDGSDVGA